MNDTHSGTLTRRKVLGLTAAASGTLLAGVGFAEAASPMPWLPSKARAFMKAFGLNYPIVEAAHGNQTCPELAIAVANAGALGALAGAAFDGPEAARTAVSKVRSATQRAFFVNFILEFGASELQIVLDAGAPIVQFSWGMPSKAMLAALQAARAKWGAQVTSTESARAALDLGADYLVCQGTEAGGHVQATRGLYETLPLVLEEARGKHVIAAGGIGNGAGIYKALAAGASAAALGTRFVATVESTAHPEYKQALVNAHARDTALTICFQGGDGWSATHRALRNRTFVMWDVAGCPSPGKRPGEFDIIATLPDGSKVHRYEDTSPVRGLGGSVTECPMWAGTSVDHIKDVPAAADLVSRLWRECEHAAATSGHHI